MTESAAVIVPTYDREEMLCQTLEQFLNQDIDDFTVHVVDHTEKHNDSTVKFLSSLPNRFHHHQLDEGEASYARNFGMDVSDSDIIIFIDDDVRFSKDFVRSHIDTFRNENIGAVAGQVLTPECPEPVNKPPIGRTTWYGRSITRLHSSQPGWVREGRGCNISFRRQVIESIGGFDTQLKFKEEADVFCRVNNSRYKIRFCPDASVYHHESIDGGTGINDQRSTDEIRILNKNRLYFHLKNKPLPTFPIAVLASFLYQAKIRRSELHKLPLDIVPMIKGTYESVRQWINSD